MSFSKMCVTAQVTASSQAGVHCVLPVRGEIYQQFQKHNILSRTFFFIKTMMPGQHQR